MSARELVVLGTSSQVPTRYRNHNGYLLRWDAHGILFDPGEGTQRQMTFANVTATAINRICVTHFHGDHCLGLAGITQRISLDGVPTRCPSTSRRPGASTSTASAMPRSSSIRRGSCLPGRRARRARARTGWYSRAPRSTTACPRSATGWRSPPAAACMLPEKLAEAAVRGPAIGALQRAGELLVGERVVRLDEVSAPKAAHAVAFVMATRSCDGALALARGVDLLVCESTYLQRHAREAHDHQHMTARQAAELARDAGARRLVLTHFSQRYPRAAEFLEEACAVFPDVVAAEDGMRVPVPARAEA
jgi:ribonuclease Z